MPRHPPRALCSLTYSKARALRGARSAPLRDEADLQHSSVGKVRQTALRRPLGSTADLCRLPQVGSRRLRFSVYTQHIGLTASGRCAGSSYQDKEATCLRERNAA